MTLQKPTPNRAPAIWEKAFLKVLSKTGNVTKSARAAKVDRSTVYDHRNNDPVFAALWLEAEAEASDLLEAEAWRRAVEGVNEPVFQGGEQVGVIRKYSDSLMGLLLKAHKPEKYRERTDVTSNGKAIKGYIGISPDDWDEPK